MIASSLDDLYVYQVDIIQCSWRISLLNRLCIQNHLFINISSSSLSKTLLSFDLSRSIYSIFHLIHKLVSIWRWTFQSNFLFFSQISIETNNLSFKYQNISNFRWDSCQHDWMTIHLNDNHHDVSFSFEQLKQFTRHCFHINKRFAQQVLKTSTCSSSFDLVYHSQS